MSKTIRLLLCAGMAAIGLAACGGSSKPSSTTTSSGSTGASTQSSSSNGPTSVTITTAKVGGLGTVLVNSSGRALYVFAPDGGKKVTCNADCQSIWPPAASPAKGVAKAGGKAEQSLIGSLPNPATGGRIVTYGGWPLYTYVADNAPDQATGQNVDLNGGYWWVISASGKIIK